MGRSGEALGLSEAAASLAAARLARMNAGAEPTAPRGKCARCKNPAIFNLDIDRWEHHFEDAKTPTIEEVVALDRNHTAWPEVSITDLLQRSLGRNPPTAAEVLGELARALTGCADRAWDQSSEKRASTRDVEAEYARGRAHAFCEALGDQAALAMYGVWD